MIVLGIVALALLASAIMSIIALRYVGREDARLREEAERLLPLPPLTTDERNTIVDYECRARELEHAAVWHHKHERPGAVQFAVEEAQRFRARAEKIRRGRP